MAVPSCGSLNTIVTHLHRTTKKQRRRTIDGETQEPPTTQTLETNCQPDMQLQGSSLEGNCKISSEDLLSLQELPSTSNTDSLLTCSSCETRPSLPLTSNLPHGSGDSWSYDCQQAVHGLRTLGQNPAPTYCLHPLHTSQAFSEAPSPLFRTCALTTDCTYDTTRSWSSQSHKEPHTAAAHSLPGQRVLNSFDSSWLRADSSSGARLGKDPADNSAPSHLLRRNFDHPPNQYSGRSNSKPGEGLIQTPPWPDAKSELPCTGPRSLQVSGNTERQSLRGPTLGQKSHEHSELQPERDLRRVLRVCELLR